MTKKFCLHKAVVGCILCVMQTKAMLQPTDASTTSCTQSSISAATTAGSSLAQNYMLEKTIAATPDLRSWILQHVVLGRTIAGKNWGCTPLAAMNSDQTYTAFVTDEKPTKVYVCGATTGECLKKLVSTSRIRTVAFKPLTLGYKRILTTSDDKTARLWNGKSELCDHVLGHEPFDVNTGAVYCEQGDHLLTIDGARCNMYSVKEHDNVEKEQVVSLYKIIGHNQPVTSAAFNKQDTLVATGALDDSVHLTNLKTGYCVAAISLNFKYGWAPKILFNPAGTRLIVVAGDPATVLIIDVGTEKIIYKSENVFSGSCKAMRFADVEGNILEIVSLDGATRRLDLSEFNKIDSQFPSSLTGAQAELLVQIYDQSAKNDAKFDLNHHPLAKQWKHLTPEIKNLLSKHLAAQ